MNQEDLIKGRMYCYWSKGINEKKPSLKFCRLVDFAKRYAIVDRLDLSINKRQQVEIKRLKEVQKKKQYEQKELPL
jgi:hypothetical protein